MKYRKKPVTVDATQWHKNGDHPDDNVFRPFEDNGEIPEVPREGAVVRYFRHPHRDGQSVCKHCGRIMHDHGWIDTLEGGHIVCPGDYIITGVKGERYPCKPDIFQATNDLVANAELDAKDARIAELEEQLREADGEALGHLAKAGIPTPEEGFRNAGWPPRRPVLEGRGVMGKLHHLKCWPSYYRDVVCGKKTFEFRKDDRDFQIGDVLVLAEWDPDTRDASGEMFSVRVTYVARGSLIPEGFCVMSIEPFHDRDRRIRELVREWVGRKGPAKDTGDLFRQATEEIDAIDAAEIPPKASE